MNWASGVDLKTGRPIQNPEARFDQTGKVAFVTPTGRGAHNWQPMSFNPSTGLVYFGSRHNAQAYIPMPAADFKVSNVGTNVGLVRPVPDAVTAELEARPDLQFEDRGAMLGWGPRRPQAALALRRQERRRRRRHAVDGRQPHVRRRRRAAVHRV